MKMIFLFMVAMPVFCLSQGITIPAHSSMDLTTGRITKCPLDTISGVIFSKNYDYNNGVTYRQGYYIGYCAGSTAGGYLIEDSVVVDIIWPTYRGKYQEKGNREWKRFETSVTGKFVDMRFKEIATAEVMFMIKRKKAASANQER